MNAASVFLLITVPVFLSAQAPTSLVPDPPIACSDCDAWNKPHEPFRVFGSTYYVGTAGLTSLLITSEAGSILLDGALPQSAPLIDRSIRALGFRTQDIRLILNSHEHYDHAGGIAALQRATGATVAASEAGARALMRGYPTADDPQYESGRTLAVTPVTNVRIVKDGEVVRVGDLAVTAHLTPGHTPGSTTWTWRSCEGPRCLDMVYADSLTAISDPGFRFTGDAKRPSIVERFRRTIATVEQLPCDVVLSTHPSATGVHAKFARYKAHPNVNPFIDANGCRDYAAAARKRLDARVAEEQKGGL
jgi:metallo-beta-lactamase class B